MKLFWKNLLFSRISPALWLIAALWGIFVISGAPEQKAKAVQQIFSAPQQHAPLKPVPAENSERGTFRSAIPGTTPPAVVSRRGHEPVALRLLRSGNAGLCSTEAWLLPQLRGIPRQKPNYHFSFQSFLQHSLPPRAGPQAV